MACKKALNHPIDSLNLIDLTGIDVHYYVKMQHYQESRDESGIRSKIATEMFHNG